MPGPSRLLPLLAVTLLATAGDAAAVDPAGEQRWAGVDVPPPTRDHYTLTIYWENDGGYLQPNHPRDRYYTNGVALGVTHQPDWAQRLAPHMPFAERFGPAKTGAGYILGQQMFTPADIEDPERIEDDRPYAGYLFAGVYWQRATGQTQDHFQINLGLVGPSTRASDAQRDVHELVKAREPRGWEHQLRDEPVVQGWFYKKWRWSPLTPGGPWAGRDMDVQVLPLLGAAVGTAHRHLEVGSTLRVGFNLPDDFGRDRIHDPVAATAEPRRGWGAHVFGYAGLRFVEHNMFLRGNNFRSGGHGVSAKPIVGEVQLGLAASYRGPRWAGEVSYSQNFQSDEFTGQDGAHSFGTIVFSVTGWF